MGLLRCHSREVATLAGDRQTEEVDCLRGIWLHFRNYSKHVVYGRITIFSIFFFIGIVVSFMNVGMKYFEYYILYVSVWLFVICFVLFFFCNGYYMDINAGTAFLNAALLSNTFSFLSSACWEFFFQYFTVF